MIKCGFNLTEMKPQPLKFDYLKRQFLSYFSFRDNANYSKIAFGKKEYLNAFNLLNLSNRKFYYFKEGSFSHGCIEKPQVIREEIKNISISSKTIRLNDSNYDKAYITPGMIVDHYYVGNKYMPFSFKEKASVHLFIYIKEPNYDISYVRVTNHKKLFRFSRADYSDNRYYLLAGDWDESLSTDIVSDLFKKMDFCNDYKIIKKSVVVDRKATTVINESPVEYIYNGGKNMMSAASQIFN